MQHVREQAVTDEVIASFAGAPSERLREVMSSLVRHLHDFAREVRLTEAEWQRGIDFLTRVGHTTTDKRQEFILLSDVLGLSMLTVAVNAPATAGATESTVFGPFFVEDAPEVPLGGDIARGAKGSPCLCLRDRPLRRWHAAAGSADRGLGSRRGRLLRRPVRRRSQRRPAPGSTPEPTANTASGPCYPRPIRFPTTDRSAICCEPPTAARCGPRTCTTRSTPRGTAP